MARFTRTLFILLTALAATAAGALNGRIACLVDSGNVALEQPHRGTKHTPLDHGYDGGFDPDRHTPDRHTEDEECTDIGAGGTLVREAAVAAYCHEHAPLALPLVSPVLAAGLLAACPRSPELRFAGIPPAFADLTFLRSIILLV